MHWRSRFECRHPHGETGGPAAIHPADVHARTILSPVRGDVRHAAGRGFRFLLPNRYVNLERRSKSGGAGGGRTRGRGGRGPSGGRIRPARLPGPRPTSRGAIPISGILRHGLIAGGRGGAHGGVESRRPRPRRPPRKRPSRKRQGRCSGQRRGEGGEGRRQRRLPPTRPAGVPRIRNRTPSPVRAPIHVNRSNNPPFLQGQGDTPVARTPRTPHRLAELAVRPVQDGFAIFRRNPRGAMHPGGGGVRVPRAWRDELAGRRRAPGGRMRPICLQSAFRHPGRELCRGVPQNRPPKFAQDRRSAIREGERPAARAEIASCAISRRSATAPVPPPPKPLGPQGPTQAQRGSGGDSHAPSAFSTVIPRA